MLLCSGSIYHGYTAAHLVAASDLARASQNMRARSGERQPFAGCWLGKP